MLNNHMKKKLDSVKARVEQKMADELDNLCVADEKLKLAMRYSLLNGGKRIRPFLIYTTAQVFLGTAQQADAAAVAVEMLHSYSLVHDDLPAMDDDDLRRGKPTCHIKYDEASAILAGDALLTGAFEVLSKAPLSDVKKLKLIALLASASGASGMVAGQSTDLNSVGQCIDVAQLEAMHRLKTGALIKASVLMGAYCGDVELSSAYESALINYADAIGLAFQVQDDLLDILGDTQTLGKNAGADEALNKPTYPALLGIDGAKEQANKLINQAKSALNDIPYKTEVLSQLADYIINRQH